MLSDFLDIEVRSFGLAHNLLGICDEGRTRALNAALKAGFSKALSPLAYHLPSIESSLTQKGIKPYLTSTSLR